MWAKDLGGEIDGVLKSPGREWAGLGRIGQGDLESINISCCITYKGIQKDGQ